MHVRIALLGLMLVAGLGGAAGAVPGAAPVVSSSATSSVKPLPWTLVGNVRDYICPDAVPSQLLGLTLDV